MNCPSCNTPMFRDETIPLEGGVMVRCPECGHLTPIWNDGSEETAVVAESFIVCACGHPEESHSAGADSRCLVFSCNCQAFSCNCQAFMEASRDQS